MLRASCLKLEMNEFGCYEAKIEESEKGRQLPGVEPRTHLAWAASTLQLSHVRIGGCPAIVAQWQSTGGSSQMCPGFNSQQLLATGLFHFPLLSPHNIQIHLLPNICED